MRPLLCCRYSPLEQTWSSLKLKYCVLSPAWKSRIILGIDCAITIFFLVACTLGVFGTLGSVIKWIGWLNLWRVGVTLFGTIAISTFWTDTDQVPLATEPGENTQKAFWILYVLGHLPLGLGALGVFGTGTFFIASLTAVGLLGVAKIAHLFHPKEIDALDCIQFFIP